MAPTSLLSFERVFKNLFKILKVVIYNCEDFYSYNLSYGNTDNVLIHSKDTAFVKFHFMMNNIMSYQPLSLIKILIIDVTFVRVFTGVCPCMCIYYLNVFQTIRSSEYLYKNVKAYF